MAFESVKDVEFPDILLQLKTEYPARMEIDKAFLKVLGYKGDADSLWRDCTNCWLVRSKR